MKDYNVLNELVPKTQELHRAIFDKGYEQGQIDEQVNILVKIRAEIKKESDVKALQLHWGEAMGLNRAIDIIDKYISELRGDTDEKSEVSE